VRVLSATGETLRPQLRRGRPSHDRGPSEGRHMRSLVQVLRLRTCWAYDVFSRQLTGANGSGSYVYDAFGRQTTLPSTDAPNPAGGDITIGYYDTDAVASMSQGTSLTVTELFTLDPAGRRLQQQTSDGTTTTTVSRHYGNSSDNPTWATQISGSTTATTRYLGALGGGLSATSTTQGSITTNSLTLVDPGGSIVATVDIPASGNADSITGYATSDEYGAAASYVDTGVLQYGWQGSEQRAVTGIGLTLMGARVYNSASARFSSVDPVSGGGEDPYAYALDPVNFGDSTGNCVERKSYKTWHTQQKFPQRNYKYERWTLNHCATKHLEQTISRWAWTAELGGIIVLIIGLFVDPSKILAVAGIVIAIIGLGLHYARDWVERCDDNEKGVVITLKWSLGLATKKW
jgi:RHS repeat-associated protein